MLLPGPTTANKENETTHNPKAKLYMNVFVCIIQTKTKKKKNKNQEKDYDKQNAQKLNEKLQKKIAFPV